MPNGLKYILFSVYSFVNCEQNISFLLHNIKLHWIRCIKQQMFNYLHLLDGQENFVYYEHPAYTVHNQQKMMTRP